MAPQTALEGRRILVIEDDYLVAQVLCDLLEELGAVTVGPIGWASEALAFIESSEANFDSAIIDVNLHGEKSYPVAEALMRRNVRFALATGYGADGLDEAYRSLPRCEKPFDQNALIAALS